MAKPQKFHPNLDPENCAENLARHLSREISANLGQMMVAYHVLVERQSGVPEWTPKTCPENSESLKTPLKILGEVFGETR